MGVATETLGFGRNGSERDLRDCMSEIVNQDHRPNLFYSFQKPAEEFPRGGRVASLWARRMQNSVIKRRSLITPSPKGDPAPR